MTKSAHLYQNPAIIMTDYPQLFDDKTPHELTVLKYTGIELPVFSPTMPKTVKK